MKGLIFILYCSVLHATFLIFDDVKTFTSKTKHQVFDLILRHEPPRSFYTNEIDLQSKCEEASLDLKWIPPSLYQLGVLHAFLFDQEIRSDILSYLKEGWPLSYDDEFYSHLKSSQNIGDVLKYFDEKTESLDNICELFFKVNKWIVSLYRRGNLDNLETLRIVLSEISYLSDMEKKEFPFWKGGWITNPDVYKYLYKTLADRSFLEDCLKIEEFAYKNGEWVLYRGYEGETFPSTLQEKGEGSHALSFGSTLLGGVIFSLESSAIAYHQPWQDLDHQFLALRVTPEEMRKYFRWGPLHPFVQMLVDGEMFHAHTKIVSDTCSNQSLEGYFMKCNKNYMDPVGYLLETNLTSKQFDQDFRSLCKRSGHIFKTK